jgi:signal transduction histidine kinase
LFYHFVCVFLGQDNRKSILVHYALGVLFLAAYPSHFFFKRMDFVWGSLFFMRSGPLHYVFFLWWMGLVVYSHYLLLLAYRCVSSVKRDQIKYFFVATAGGYTGGSLCYLPAFGIDLYPWGNFTVFLYPIIMSYAILKHHLMDINFVIRKTLVYSLLSAAMAAVYVGTINALAYLIGGSHGTASAFPSALAAIVITLLFNPARMRIQWFVDHYFFREALDQAILREATSGFAHEIKRPLAKISLPAELALRDVEDLMSNRRPSNEVLPKMQQRLQYILDQTADAGNKIEAIREFSHSNGKPPEEVNLAAVIRKSVAVEDGLLRRHQVELKLDISSDLPTIQGHSKQLEIVLTNLIKNAAEAMTGLDSQAARQVWITALQTGGNILVTVKDSGPGIKPEIRAKLFEPYFTTKGACGTGLGLYMCKQIIHAHGGNINVRSDNRGGAEFVLAIPIDSR